MDLLEFIKSVWAEDRQALEDIPCQSSPDRGRRLRNIGVSHYSVKIMAHVHDAEIER
jgi:hypothetical protein